MKENILQYQIKKKKQNPLLEAIDINCTQLAAGETMTLENRNDGVDYIMNCVFGTYGDFIIEPGVTIQFGTDAGITVYNGGSIQALGTAQDPIVFTGEDKVPGAWKGIFINSNDLKNKIEYTTIEYAGGEAFNSNGDKGGVIVYADTHLNMNNTTIKDSETYGFNAGYGGCELVLEDNTITNCVVPMLVLPNYVDAIVGGNYTGNETDAIYVANGFNSIDATYRDLGVPYHVLARLVVSAGGGKLTINPGVVMEFGLSGGLEVNEGASGSKPSLVAVGTAENPILFTAIDKVEGAWNGIYFDTPSALNEIGFATIEYASTLDYTGAITNWSGTVLNVHDVLFKDIKYCAIRYKQIGVTTSNLSYDNVGAELCED
ncbi:hypothetical protein ACU8V7_10740 [Zobellia nedashkovskayae]